VKTGAATKDKYVSKLTFFAVARNWNPLPFFNNTVAVEAWQLTTWLLHACTQNKLSDQHELSLSAFHLQLHFQEIVRWNRFLNIWRACTKANQANIIVNAMQIDGRMRSFQRDFLEEKITSRVAPKQRNA